MISSPPNRFEAFLPPFAAPRRLQHLALLESPPTDSADASTLRRAADSLVEAGLAARIVSTSPARIVGGRRRVNRDGLVTYDDAFSLWRERDGSYCAAIAGRGNLGIRSGPSNLDNALAFLRREYEKPVVPAP